MRHFSHRAFAIGAIAILGCTSPTGTDDAELPNGEVQDGASTNPASLDSVIAAVPTLPVPTARGEVLDSITDDTTVVGNVPYICTVRHVTLADHFDEHVLFATSNIDVIWPGSVVQLGSVHTGIPDPIGLPRATVDVFVDLPSISEVAQVASPNAATVHQAVYGLLRTAQDGSNPAAISAQYVQAHSTEQAAIKMGFNAGFLGFKARAAFSERRSLEQNELFVKVIQKYYTVAVATPRSASAVFDSTVTADELGRWTGADNPAGYISTVTYGRILVFKMTSSEGESHQTLEAAFKLGVFGEGDATRALEETFERSQLEVLVLGGNARSAARAITANDVSEFLEASAEFSPTSSPGIPISYTVRHLADFSLVNLAATTEYQIRECRLDAERVRVTVLRLDVYADCDQGVFKGSGHGEFLYKVFVTDGDGVRRTVVSGGPAHVHSGRTHYINRSLELLMPKIPGRTLRIQGSLAEDDRGDHTRMGEFDRVLTYGTETWVAGAASYYFNRDGDCRARLFYEVEFLP